MYILAIDEGTSSTRSIIFNDKFEVIAVSQRELEVDYPKPGWVEQDANEIWQKTLQTMEEVLEKANLKWKDISAIGITNQRETTVAWDKNTGEPLYKAIVWQCRRTESILERFSEEFWEEIKNKTGLVKDPYFSASKILWLMENVDAVKQAHDKGTLKFGTVESWLAYKLSGKHFSDLSNASRTMLLNLERLEWDEEILKAFKIPINTLPNLIDTFIYQGIKTYLGPSIYSMIGDQQSALFGHRGVEEGSAKSTYGTGAFILMNIGSKAQNRFPGILTSVGWKTKSIPVYVFEGSIFTVGAVFKWLKDIEFIKDYSELEKYARDVDNGGVYFVPAFSGLGTPEWDSSARGLIIGITRAANKGNILRSVLEGVAFSVKNVIETMEKASNIKLQKLNVDGGVTKNDLLMEIQSTLLDSEIFRPNFQEITALGAAAMAAISSGIISIDEFKNIDFEGKSFLQKKKKKDYYIREYLKWKEALNRSKNSTQTTKIPF